MERKSCPKPIKPPKLKKWEKAVKIKKPLSITQLRLQEKKEIKKLTIQVKQLCSHICRKMWGGKCAVCGKPGTAAHHFFGWKACAVLRFTLNNLIWLCYYCHIGKVHQQGLTEPVRVKIIERIGQEAFDAMYEIAFSPKTWGLEELKLIKLSLEGLLNETK